MSTTASAVATIATAHAHAAAVSATASNAYWHEGFTLDRCTECLGRGKVHLVVLLRLERIAVSVTLVVATATTTTSTATSVKAAVMLARSIELVNIIFTASEEII